jgi:hypothetical protein
MEGYDRAVQLCTALDSQPQDTLRLVFPRFADESYNAQADEHVRIRESEVGPSCKRRVTNTCFEQLHMQGGDRGLRT